MTPRPRMASLLAADFEVNRSRPWLLPTLRGRSGPEPAGADLPDRPDRSAGPEELAIAAAGGTPVAAAIGLLPEHHRDVIALVFVAGLPLADVAEVLAIPVGTVKSRLHHARAAVAAALTAQEAPE